MKMEKSIILFIILCCISLSSCSDDKEDPKINFKTYLFSKEGEEIIIESENKSTAIFIELKREMSDDERLKLNIQYFENSSNIKSIDSEWFSIINYNNKQIKIKVSENNTNERRIIPIYLYTIMPYADIETDYQQEK